MDNGEPITECGTITFLKYMDHDGDMFWKVHYSEGLSIYETQGVLSIEHEYQNLYMLESRRNGDGDG